MNKLNTLEKTWGTYRIYQDVWFFWGGYVTIPVAQENHPYDLYMTSRYMERRVGLKCLQRTLEVCPSTSICKSRKIVFVVIFLSLYVCMRVMYMYIFKVYTVELFPMKPENSLAKRPRKSQALWTWETLRRPRGGLDAVWRRPDGAKAAAGVHMRES